MSNMLSLISAVDNSKIKIFRFDIAALIEPEPQHEQVIKCYVVLHNGMTFPVKETSDKIMEELWDL